MQDYDSSFYEILTRESSPSAEVIVPLLLQSLRVQSVLDLGCGVGSFLAEFEHGGVHDLVGVEGEWARAAPLLLSSDHFRFLDLTHPIDLARQFDLVMCLEVAEHIDASAAETLVDTLTGHGSAICFSAAPPGQGGTHHVNEQWPEFWAKKFSKRGFDAFDVIRPQVYSNRKVMIHYAQNTLMYSKQGTEAHRRLSALSSPHPPVNLFRIRWTHHPLAGRSLNYLPEGLRKFVYSSVQSHRRKRGALRAYRQ